MKRLPAITSFLEALASDGPHPAIPDECRIFAPFIGSWDLVVSWFDEGARLIRQERGEWHFSWVLEGRGIQDVWIVPPRDERAMRPEAGEYGTSLRFYDEELNAWQSIWVGPFANYVRRFIAQRIEDRVVLETVAGEATRMRWSFSEIGADSFTWRNELWDEDRWRVQQTFDARRSRM